MVMMYGQFSLNGCTPAGSESRKASGGGRGASGARTAILAVGLGAVVMPNSVPFLWELWRASFRADSCYTRVGACIAFINPRLFDAAPCQNQAFESVA